MLKRRSRDYLKERKRKHSGKKRGISQEGKKQ